ncbi:porin [uncultured Hydrogenophaga sp.]|uniref:porin n=1 Tax=uncultured Hydrogenophaga sp. TaxID=199683 RepID=UPI00265D8279|nr:porin [uncultured Hydrogenophaga sp.]
MKKSLIALAVLAASGAAMAQSSVSVYGLVDVWVGNEKSSTQAGSAGSFGKMGGNEGFATSRLGFKGTEDLGGGLKANFQIETSIRADQPQPSSLGDRQAWVGLSGGFGEVQLGRVWTPYDDTRALINDTFNANFAASFLNWEGYFDRTSNGIRYNTPSFSGFSAAGAYAFGEDKTATAKASSLTSVSLNYANGPIAAGLAYQVEKDGAGAGTIYADASSLSALLAGVTDTKRTYTLINGSYDLGVAKLLAGYNTVKATSSTAVGEATADEWNVGVEVPFGANLSAALGYAKSQVELNNADNNETKGFSLAVKYALSKRTFTYVGATSTKQTFTGNANFNKTTQYFAGVSHAF